MIRFILSTTCAAALTLGAVLPLQAETAAGAYLAARYAAIQADYEVASQYYTEALMRDPSNAELVESATLAYVSLGRIDNAKPLAQTLMDAGQNSQIAQMIHTIGLIDAKDWSVLQALTSEEQGIGPWVDGLVQAWSHVETGEIAQAMSEFDALSKEDGLQGFVMYHKALALALGGDFAAADAILSGPQAGSSANTRRGVLAHVEILSQLGRNQDALDVITKNFGSATDPELDAVIAQLQGDAPMAFDHVTSVRDGMAEVYYTFAAVLRNQQAGDYYTLLFARMARHLRSDHIDALLLTANLLESLGQNDLAIEEYKQVKADDPAYHAAELGRAAALRRSEKPEQAIEVLNQLTRSHGNLAVVHSTLGDALRAQEDFSGAIEAYDQALSLTPEASNARWLLYYTRGIAQERNGNWDRSEADFRAALAIDPAHPQVLNYLGYSLVERQEKLPEALDMIERAVAASPESGYIVDSLGWVYYRLGRYQEAVVQMERAVELLAVDPVVNDHLGDVYWAVGRAREAEFQWNRALSLIDKSDEDTEAEPERIRRKLAVGLDEVLAEEGAEPLKVAND